MYDVVVKKFTFAISSPDEFLVCLVYHNTQFLTAAKLADTIAQFTTAIIKLLVGRITKNLSSSNEYHERLGFETLRECQSILLDSSGGSSSSSGMVVVVAPCCGDHWQLHPSVADVLCGM